jgi:hypothetical protein
MFKLIGRDGFLNNDIDGRVANLKADLLVRRDISLDGHPGKSFEASFKDDDGRVFIRRGRDYLVGNRLYQVVHTGPRDEVTPRKSGEFFKSFALMNPPAPKPERPLASLFSGMPFVSKEGRFRVGFAKPPREETRKLPTAGGEVLMHSFTTTEGPVVSTVSYADYAELLAKLFVPDKVMEKAVTASIDSIKGKLTTKRDVTLDGYPGKAFEATVGEHLHRSRIYLVGNRLYSLIHAGPRDAMTPEMGEDFFKSFALVDTPAARPAVPAVALERGKPFASREGRFRIGFTGPPREVIQKMPSPAGELTLHVIVVDGPDAASFATWVDSPGKIAPEVADSVLEDSVKKSIAQAKATLISKKDIRVDGHPGKEYDSSMSLPDGRPGLCRSRYALAGNRIYQVFHISDKAKLDAKARDAFLDSFKIDKPSTP